MKYKIVNLKEIQKCRNYNLSPEHWISEHKIEECRPDLRRRLQELEEEEKLARAKAFENIKQESVARIEKFKKKLRNHK